MIVTFHFGLLSFLYQYSTVLVEADIILALLLQRPLQKQLCFSGLCITWGGPLNRIDLGWYFSVLDDSTSFLLLFSTLVSPAIDSCRELAAMPYKRWRRAGPKRKREERVRDLQFHYFFHYYFFNFNWFTCILLHWFCFLHLSKFENQSSRNRVQIVLVNQRKDDNFSANEMQN